MAVCLASCAKHEVAEEKPVAEARTAEQAAAALGNPLLADRGDINAINYNVSTSEQLESIDNGVSEELIWTNPDDPDADIPALTEAFANRRNGNAWQSDMGYAIKLARQNELPLIVWFHDSVVSPASNALGKEYLNTKEFNDWCNGRVIRLRLDSGESLNDATAGSARYNFKEINALQRRYGLTKKPSLAIITPSGKIVERIDGFDGFLNGFIRDLQNGVKMAENEYKEYKENLRARGFREWRPARGGRSVFAKFVRYDAQRKLVYLKEGGGRISSTRLSAFCREDIDYLMSLIDNKEKKADEQI